MKSWIKYGLAGALILVASFWGGSGRRGRGPLKGARARLSPSFPNIRPMTERAGLICQRKRNSSRCSGAARWASRVWAMGSGPQNHTGVC